MVENLPCHVHLRIDKRREGFATLNHSRPTKRLRRQKIQTNICQVFILCSAWGFILRPPKGETTNLVPPFLSAKTREKPLKKN